MFKIFKKRKKVVSVEVQQYLKSHFRSFFECSPLSSGGYSDPIINIPIIKFGITDIHFENGVETIDMYITLERPGILIGRGGRVINNLERYLRGPQHSDMITKKINVKIIESKIW